MPMDLEDARSRLCYFRTSDGLFHAWVEPRHIKVEDCSLNKRAFNKRNQIQHSTYNDLPPDSPASHRYMSV